MPPPTSAQMIFSLITFGLLGGIVVAWIWAIGRLIAGRLLPPAPPKTVPWSGMHVLGTVLLYMGLAIVVPLGLRATGLLRVPQGQAPGPGLILLVMMSVNVAFLAIAPAVLSGWSGARLGHYLPPRDQAGVDILRGLVAWPLLAPMIFGVLWVSLKIWSGDRHPMEDFIKGSADPLDLAFAAVSAVVVAPLAEEYFFRGVLLGWLDGLTLHRRPSDGPGPSEEITFLERAEDAPETTPGDASEAPVRRRRGGLLAANVFVSLLFAAIHGSVWPSPVPIFVLSLGLGLLYQRTGGLVAPITLHAAFNGVSTALMILQISLGIDGRNPPKAGDLIPPEASARLADPRATLRVRPF